MEADYPKTDLEYLLVLDFQATCQENKKLEPCSEIIEFPIIVAHLPSGKKLDVFHHYVKPKYHPVLTKFCTELTGITQQMVNSGKVIQEVLQQLDKWITSLKYLTEDNFAFVTCGDWDLRTCLRQEAKEKKLYIKNYLRKYINIKRYFAKIINQNGSRGMMAMLKALGIKHEGRHHSGIDDVKNITNICLELAKNHGAVFPKKQINIVKFNLPPQNLKPEYKYLIPLFFEATCQQKAKIEPCPEIIEITASIIDSHCQKVIGEFHEHAQPKYNQKLIPFCLELAGISQETVDKARPIEEILHQFDKWIISQKDLTKDNFIFVTCGDWDLCTCLRLEAKKKQIKIPSYFEKYINIKAYFPKLIQTKEKVKGIPIMLETLKIKPIEKPKNGRNEIEHLNQICLKLLQKHEAKFPKSEARTIKF